MSNSSSKSFSVTIQQFFIIMMSFSFLFVRRVTAFHIQQHQINTRRNLPSLIALYSNKPHKSTRTSSWMDKNENFARYESQEPLVFDKNSNKSTDKQRRRRNEKRREDYNQKVVKEEEKKL